VTGLEILLFEAPADGRNPFNQDRDQDVSVMPASSSTQIIGNSSGGDDDDGVMRTSSGLSDSSGCHRRRWLSQLIS
jgi:hypothetical protein